MFTYKFGHEGILNKIIDAMWTFIVNKRNGFISE